MKIGCQLCPQPQQQQSCRSEGHHHDVKVTAAQVLVFLELDMANFQLDVSTSDFKLKFHPKRRRQTRCFLSVKTLQSPSIQVKVERFNFNTSSLLLSITVGINCSSVSQAVSNVKSTDLEQTCLSFMRLHSQLVWFSHILLLRADKGDAEQRESYARGYSGGKANSTELQFWNR